MRDAAAALVADGRVVAAAEEERFARTKHVIAFPARAIESCLGVAGVELTDVDRLAVPWKYWQIGTRAWLVLTALFRAPRFGRAKGQRAWERLTSEWFELATLSRTMSRHFDGPSPAAVFLDHHRCHAASTFLLSPFDRAAILVVDGASEAHTALMAIGEGSDITELRRVRLPNSLGQYYASFTAYLGFKPDCDEYIVMGLAAHGEPRYADPIREQILWLEDDGGFRLDSFLLDFHSARIGAFREDFLRIFGPKRARGAAIEQRHKDIAASVQLVLEETLLHSARYLRRRSRMENLCLAGGVAYNCVANQRLARESGFERIFVQPAAGDPGAALGAPLLLAQQTGDLERREALEHVYLGPAFSREACRAALDTAGLEWIEYTESELLTASARALAEGELVFWFQGRMEFGPRALGNRSLLADPRRLEVRDLINSKVKYREEFRPFAPAVLEERGSEFFEISSSSPFMLFTVPVRPEARQKIPAVVHVDGTARVQTVDRTSNPRFRGLLEAFSKLTDVPVLLNTSFNIQEPIVCSPEDAVACYLRSGVDVLVLDRFFVRRAPRRDGRGSAR